MDIRNATPKFNFKTKHRHYAYVYSDNNDRHKSYQAILDRVLNLSVDQQSILDFNFIENLHIIECLRSKTTVHHLTISEFNEFTNLEFERVFIKNLHSDV